MIQWLNDLLRDVTSVRIDYDNGGFISAEKEWATVRYNTGDMVWFKLIKNQWQVIGIDTQDDAVSYRV